MEQDAIGQCVMWRLSLGSDFGSLVDAGLSRCLSVSDVSQRLLLWVGTHNEQCQKR